MKREEVGRRKGQLREGEDQARSPASRAGTTNLLLRKPGSLLDVNSFLTFHLLELMRGGRSKRAKEGKEREVSSTQNSRRRVTESSVGNLRDPCT